MNCTDCRDRLDQFVDRELSLTDLKALQEHLDLCNHCNDEYRFQSNLKRLVKVACGQGEAPAQLRERLRALFA